MKPLSGNNYLKKERNSVLVDKICLEDIMKNYRTPVMIFLENKIRENIRVFNRVFASRFNNFKCFYSFKANFLYDICKIVASEGVGAELVGTPELKLALKIGVSPSNIIIGGPLLSEELIEKSIENKVKEIIIYDLEDIQKVDSIARKYNLTQNICIRINSNKYQSKLGVVLNQKNTDFLCDALKSCTNIEFTTISSHFSTQMNNIDQFKNNFKIAIEATKKLKNNGLTIRNINFGGGFPEAVIMRENSLCEIAKELKKIIEESGISFNEIYLEPGRYLVGDSGVFLTEIVKIEDDRWIFLNIGNNICPKFARCSLRFYNVSKISIPHKYKTSIAGVIPSDQDVLAKDFFFTETLNKGDIVMITNVGAYSLTFSNRFPYTLPMILLIKDSELKVIFDPNKDRDFSIS